MTQESGTTGARLHVGRPVLDWMRDNARVPDPGSQYAPGAIGSLWGLPVVEEPDWQTSGRWELRRGDRVLAEGHFGEPDRPLFYIPSQGFIDIDPAAIDSVLQLGPPIAPYEVRRSLLWGMP